jgi:hypothetical protein
MDSGRALSKVSAAQSVKSGTDSTTQTTNQRRESVWLSAGPLPAAALRSARTENKRKEVNTMIYYMNRETGELLTKAEMLEQAATEYDLNDETNGLEWSEYYDIIRES